MVLGIDPGISGAFVLTNGRKLIWWKMPVQKLGKNYEVHFEGIHELLWNIQLEHGMVDTFLERAVPFAMGSKSAFNYGRGFAAVEISIELMKLPVTYVEPQKWTKEMHQGISNDMKPKAKSLVAVHRLYPTLIKQLPINTKGALLEGPMDALLIAGYGLRKHTSK